MRSVSDEKLSPRHPKPLVPFPEAQYPDNSREALSDWLATNRKDDRTLAVDNRTYEVCRMWDVGLGICDL